MKYPKRELEDDLRDLLLDVIELVDKVKLLYNNYMISRFGESSSEHLPCDSCDDE
jgi:hypothetical protein